MSRYSSRKLSSACEERTHCVCMIHARMQLIKEGKFWLLRLRDSVGVRE